MKKHMKKRAFCIILAFMLALQLPTPVSAAKADKNQEQAVSGEKEASYEKAIVKITKKGFVADSYNGVDAIYRKGGSDGSSSTYSCAAYVKKYYSSVYNVAVNNLYGGCTPRSSSGMFNAVKTPKEGDVVYCPTSSGGTHWAVVKHVDKEKREVILIEQNYKWQQDGDTVCMVNRNLSWSGCKFFRLKK